MISFDKRSPVYEQIMSYMKQQIASGIWELGMELPSRREFAGQLQVNPNTVQRAFKEMEEAGLIFTGNNVISRVTEDEAMIVKLREEMLQTAVEAFVQAVKPLRLSKGQALRMIGEALEMEEEEYVGSETSA